MQRIRYGVIVLSMLFCAVTSATAEVSIRIGLPHVSIGVNLPLFPDLVPVPGYPVYYAPGVDGNYFFYDGMYWVYQDDTWYASSWYNGPWGFVAPEDVPLFILRVPVRYYRQHPVYFRGWMTDEPPRWGEHWGNEWEHRRSGWDRWERSSAPTPAPLPVYQRKYAGDRYPRVEQQQSLHRQQYRYQPRDTVVRQHSQQQAAQKAPAPVQREMQKEPAQKSTKQQDSRRSPSRRQEASERPGVQTSDRTRERAQQSAPDPAPRVQSGPVKERRQPPAAAPHEREPQAPTAQEQGPRSRAGEEPQKVKRPRGQDRQEGEEEEYGRERNR